MNLSELYQAYLREAVDEKAQRTAETYEGGLKHFRAFLVESGVDTEVTVTFTPQMFIDFMAWLRAKFVNIRTVRTYAHGVRDFLDWMTVKGYVVLDYADAKRIERAQKRATGKHEYVPPKMPTPGAADATLPAAYSSEADHPIYERDIAILLVLYSTGVRVQELVDLRVKDLHFDEGYLEVQSGKGSKYRTVPFDKETAAAIIRYFTERGSRRRDDPVFARHDVKANAQHKKTGKLLPLSTHAVREIVKEIAVKAGLDPHAISPHGYRHEFVKRLAQVSTLAAQAAAGHSDFNTTKGYFDPDQSYVKDAHKQIFGE
jgi:integrase/recombinase XerD